MAAQSPSYQVKMPPVDRKAALLPPSGKRVHDFLHVWCMAEGLIGLQTKMASLHLNMISQVAMACLIPSSLADSLQSESDRRKMFLRAGVSFATGCSRGGPVSLKLCVPV